MEAIILAGGLGTRLQSVVKDLPKPMANINERPFLEYMLNYLIEQNITKVLLSVCYKYQTIINYFGLDYKGLAIEYVIEEFPMGTGGAIRESLKHTNQENVFVLNGDSFFKIDFRNFLKRHLILKANLSLALKPMSNFDRYGAVKVQDGYIVAFEEKAFREFGHINGGVYILKRTLFDHFKGGQKFSFEIDFLQKNIKKLSIGTFISDTYFIDIGIPEDFQRAQKELSMMLSKG